METHYSPWMPSLAAEGQRRPPSAVDDWSKDRSATPSATPGASTSNSLDINDLISDIGAAPSGSPTSPFYNFQQTQYYVHNQPGPFNTMPYGSSSWSTASLPLSSYSSLKGATSSGSSMSSQIQSHQPQSQVPTSAQSPANESSMVIDPALTSMNNASTSTIKQQQQQFPQSNSPQTATTSSYPYSTYSGLSVSPSYISYYPPQPQQQQSPPSQGTLSPQALHASSPPSSLLGTITPSQFYGSAPQMQQQSQQQQLPPQLTLHSMASGSGSQPQVSQGLTLEQRKQQLHTSLKPLLQSSAFTGAQAVNTLIQRIENFGIQELDAGLRLEILTKIRDGAGNHYFRAWGENPGAMDITREWLKAAYIAKDGDPLAETTMPLLHIIDRLPLTLESLKNSKLGKMVVKIVKDPPTPAIKDMASNVERRWRQLVEGASKAGPTTNGHSSNNVPATAAKKRKLSEPAKAPPAKKPAVGLSKPATNSAPPMSKSASAPPVKDAKSDSSFFSAPKPKPRLPTFKKAPPPVKKEPTAGQLDVNVAQPSSIDPFQEVLKSMGKARTQSPVTTATPPTSTPTPTTNTGLTKSGKKKKAVTWAPEGKLESIKLIERAVYDDDPVGDGMHHHHNSLRDLDRGEGAALHAHLFEETLDWSEPILIEIPDDIEYVSRGIASQEKTVQEQREQTALVAIYLSDAHIPESPGEPTNIVDAEEMGKEAVIMTCGTEVDEEFFSGEHQQQPAPNFATVADLVAQLATGNPIMGVSGMNNNNIGVGDDLGMANGSNNTSHGGMPTSYIVLKQEKFRIMSILNNEIYCISRFNGYVPTTTVVIARAGPNVTSAHQSDCSRIRTWSTGRFTRRRRAGIREFF
ncbi:hypothetical protein E1B28_003991 [Marasmius oreades]|uniref:TFIIS N-terminal domain-containing protein n=1 Tax=Marasmius oreades TaxID=181124 RepID=A0A9P7UXQ9_9AGAR|nr:uncharacterized protein E1B28_003991 [Marasmius oreades]KAG7096571.1 hypothetical protein E1B28_003991 [Marasmius oreades]